MAVRSSGPENKNAICSSHMLTRLLPKNGTELKEINGLSHFCSYLE